MRRTVYDIVAREDAPGLAETFGRKPRPSNGTRKGLLRTGNHFTIADFLCVYRTPEPATIRRWTHRNTNPADARFGGPENAQEGGGENG